MTRNQPESAAAACERLTRELGFRVTRQAYRWWIKKGHPVDDLNTLRRAILNQERLPSGCDPERLRADMRHQPLFGRRLREVLEDLPLGLIDDLDAAPDRRGRFMVLVAWVEFALRELGTREDQPDGLLLTPEELEEVVQYRLEKAAEKAAATAGV